MDFPTFQGPVIAGSDLRKLSDATRAATLLAGAGIRVDRTPIGQRVSLRDGLARPSRRRLFAAEIVGESVVVASGRARGVIWGSEIEADDPEPSNWLADATVAGGAFDLAVGETLYCVAPLVERTWSGRGPLAGMESLTNTGGVGGKGGAGGGGGGGAGGAIAGTGGSAGGVSDYSLPPSIYEDPHDISEVTFPTAASAGGNGVDGTLVTPGGGGSGGPGIGSGYYDPEIPRGEISNFRHDIVCLQGGHGADAGEGGLGGLGGIGGEGLHGDAGTEETFDACSELAWTATYCFADPESASLSATPPSSGQIGVAIVERTASGLIQHQVGAILFPSLPIRYAITGDG